MTSFPPSTNMMYRPLILKSFAVCVVLGSLCQPVTTNCSTVYPGTPTYGTDCSYRCHCKDEVVCNITTGDCRNGCEFGWMGPACQYRNIAKEYKVISTNKNPTDPAEKADNAMDGNFSTQSYGADPGGSKTWLKVTFKKKYRLDRMVLHVPSSVADRYEYFRVLDWTDGVLYKHNNLTSSTMEIQLTEPVFLSTVKIRLNKQWRPLVMNEWEIFGGRDLSFNKATIESSSVGDVTYPYRAVDGQGLESNGTSGANISNTCFIGNGGEQNPWWMVDLGTIYSINEIYFFGTLANTSDMAGFSIKLKNVSGEYINIFYDEPGIDDTALDYQPRETQLDGNVLISGQIVKIERTFTGNDTGAIAICEVRVFGDCPEYHQCGYDCSNSYCKDPELTSVADRLECIHCRNGCLLKWTGEGDTCTTECKKSMWGLHCNNTCGRCLNGAGCRASDGVCIDDCNTHCKPPMCTEICNVGTYGINCGGTCGHCLNHGSCNMLTGHCWLDKCDSGWTPPLCVEHCSTAYQDVPTFGTDCSYQCHCYQEASCNVTTGECPNKCQSLWTGPACQYPSYGLFQVRYYTSSWNVIYQHADVVDTNVLEIVITSPVVAKEYQIILKTAGEILNLCEVVMYGDRELAFNRHVAQSSLYGEWFSYKAIDGKNLKSSETAEWAAAKTCFRSGIEDLPRWTVDLGNVFVIQTIQFFGRQTDLDEMTEFYISVKNDTEFVDVFYDFPPGSSVDNYQPRSYTVGDTYIATQEIRISLNRTGMLSICELKVYGDCPEDQCGLNCTKLCHCSTPYLTATNKIAGTCPDGCNGRWTGYSTFCENECNVTQWGPECERNCDNCYMYDLYPCDVITGHCPQNCSGALQPPLCTEECANGTYGLNCFQTCGHCINETSCNTTTGHCPGGCEPGWLEPLCIEHCSTVFPGLPTFGANCNYRCHCAGDVACDAMTGKCPGACADGWTSPSCQYRNVLVDYNSIQNVGGNDLLAYQPTNALDGDPSTLSKTDPANYNGRQHFVIELNKMYHISGFFIQVPNSNRGQFKKFRIEVGPSDEINDYPHLCYQHPNTEIAQGKVEIPCMQPLYTNSTRIIMNKENVPLQIRRLEITAGREIAFNKLTSQSSRHDTWYSYKGVDGRPLEDGEWNFTDAKEKCFSTNLYREASPSWSVDLGTPYHIQEIHFYGSFELELMTGFYLSIDNNSDIYHDDPPLTNLTDYQPLKIRLQEPITGQVVKFDTRYENMSAGVFQVCEVRVFGDCPPDRCGWDCSIDCYCKTPYIKNTKKISGSCPDGCRDRWTGISATDCNHECNSTEWGYMCGSTCGHCKVPPCEFDTGHCTEGCSGPWQLPLCTDECLNGMFGTDCVETCGYCDNNIICDNIDGHCPEGCVLGWKEPTCLEPCVNSTYGGLCTACGHCLNNATCDQATGHCIDGCEIGWQPPFCAEYCLNGTYGLQCVEECGDCYGNETCNHVTGLCESWVCDAGYIEPFCTQVCANATFGQNCSRECGACSGPPDCHHITGHCPWGCDDGFAGATCMEATRPPLTFMTGVAIGVAGMMTALIFCAAFCVRMYERYRASAEKKLRKQERIERARQKLEELEDLSGYDDSEGEEIDSEGNIQ